MYEVSFTFKFVFVYLLGVFPLVDHKIPNFFTNIYLDCTKYPCHMDRVRYDLKDENKKCTNFYEYSGDP